MGDGGVDEVHRRRADERGDKRVDRVVIQRPRRVNLLQHTVFEHRHPVAHRHRLHLIVGDVDGGGAQPTLQSGDL